MSRDNDLTTGEGAALWSEVAARLQARLATAGVEEPEIPGGFAEPILVPRRIGQGTFRIAVTLAYQRQCAITREKALPALEAAHIRPFADTPRHYVRHGLLLRSDVHRLFDAGYITVTPDYKVEASSRMRDDFNDGENYIKRHGTNLWVPSDPQLRPDPEVLQWHNENSFRG